MMTLSIREVRNYLRVGDIEDEEMLTIILNSAIEFVKNHTGLDEDMVLSKPDLQKAVLIICSDFYWNKDYQTSNKYHNKLVESIIENNRVNFV